VAPAEAHCAVNLSLYRIDRPDPARPSPGRVRRLWSMTERSERTLERDARHLSIGPSRLRWQGQDLLVSLDEWAVPWPRKLRGELCLMPAAGPSREFDLDAAGHHRWQPVAPRARLAVDLSSPAWRWQGDAYLDHNRGDRPLELDFAHWQWQRQPAADGPGSRIAYVTQPRTGPPRALHLSIGRDGRLQTLDAPATHALPTTAWGIARTGHGPRPLSLAGTLENGPFYARSLLQDADGGLSVHESLSLDRFDRRWVQALLPFRMPRWG
jgi:carotenoid 1,2-hydratase